MVCEISSPSNAATDHILKLHLYAQAGIPHYLLIDREADGPHAVAFTLDRSGTYRPAAKAEPGQTLVLAEPFAFTIDLGELARATRPPRG